MNRDKDVATVCLLPDRLWKVALGKDIWTIDEVRHIRGCAGCRRQLAGVMKSLHLQATEANAQKSALLVGMLAYIALQQVARRVGAGRWDTAGPRDLPREQLTFDDPDLGATLLINPDGKHWLDVTHTILPAGTLVRVRIGKGEAAWVRFAVLRKDDLFGPIASMEVDEALGNTEVPLAIDLVASTMALTEQDVPVLRGSFVAMLRDDPAAVPAWQAWAAEELAQPDLRPSLRAVLEAIHRGDRPESPRAAASLASIHLREIETVTDRRGLVG